MGKHSENVWTKVGELDSLKEGVPVKVRTDAGDVLVVRVDDTIHACGNKCTHYGGPLDEGVLDGTTVVCPWHTAHFDVTTGSSVLPPALDAVGCYEVKAERGIVYVGAKKKREKRKALGRKKETFVIVGAGAAGTACAQTLRSEGFDGKVVMITREKEPPYDRPSLSKPYMQGQMKEEKLPLHDASFYKDHDIELETGSEVAGLDPARRELRFADNRGIAFDRLLIATGGCPRKPGIKGTDLDGFFLLRTLADARGINAAVEEASNLAIVGAGFIGMELAASLTMRGKRVTVIAPEEVPMAHVFGERIGRWLKELHESKGVRFHLQSRAGAITGTRKVERVVFDDGGDVEADLVIAGMGIVPAVSWLKETTLVENGAVPVDARLQTSADGIFAAGDVATYPWKRTGQTLRVEHWVHAERQGQHAARAMLGAKDAYDEPPFFWTRQFGVSLEYVGHAAADDVVLRGELSGDGFLAGFYENDKLRAVAGSNRSEEVIASLLLLKAGIDVPRADFDDLDLLDLYRRNA